MSQTPSSPPGTPEAGRGAVPAEIDASCRVSLLILFISAAKWLLIGSAFALISSLKFHAPGFLADCAWFTYGRTHAAGLDAMLYGFCIQAGLGVGLWLLARLGRATLAQSWFAAMGAVLWNLGVTVGVLGILAGDSTGFETLEMPGYAVVFVFLGYVMIAIAGLLAFHQRSERALFPSQWFVVTALYWFPWIYSSANLLLLKFPVRGVTQAAVAWWYSNNLLLVWLGLIGLGAVFYFVPKLARRELHSRYLALFTFWLLLLAGSWCGIPNSAPLPAWMPAVSTVATALMVIPLLTVGLSVYRTLGGKCSQIMTHPSLQFIGIGVAAFVVAGLMNILGVFLDFGHQLHFTWFHPAQMQLHYYGFFAMTMFGAIYYIAPKLTGMEFPSPRLVQAHFWLAIAGLIFGILPLALGGIVEAMNLQDSNVAFIDVMKQTLPFLRVSTMGDLLIAFGHVLFLVNLIGLARRFYRPRATAAYAEATADLFKPAGAKP
jgi:cytochrome c oxidase cbb3-type subunit 1